MSNKILEINIENGLQENKILVPLERSMFNSRMAGFFGGLINDNLIYNRNNWVAPFDGIHDFKSFSTNPIDTLGYSRAKSQYDINKCLFNFNRIMCRGENAISIKNSFLTKQKGNADNTNAYDNKPSPITSTGTVEDFFCLCNLYNKAKRAAVEGEPAQVEDLFIIRSVPKILSLYERKTNIEAISSKIIERGWADRVGNDYYINTITDVSPVFNKYYIRDAASNRTGFDVTVGGPGEAQIKCHYRPLVSQETANDPAGSLTHEKLTGVYGDENILVEDGGQRRTYVSQQVSSFFRPTLNGVSYSIASPISGPNLLDFFTNLLLVDETPSGINAEPLPDVSLKIPYSKTGEANPNERSEINKSIVGGFKGQLLNTCPGNCTMLNGRDVQREGNPQAVQFYSAIQPFSGEAAQRTIARHYTRKRLGDVLQASLCRLINCQYTPAERGKRIRFKKLLDGSEVIPERAIFIGEDRMIIAFCLINGIPCIYDNKRYTILYLPTRESRISPRQTPEEEAINVLKFNTYTSFATIPEQAPIHAGGEKSSSFKHKYNNINLQYGGEVITRDDYKTNYISLLWFEPYYFFKYLHSLTPQLTIAGSGGRPFPTVQLKAYQESVKSFINVVNEKIISSDDNEVYDETTPNAYIQHVYNIVPFYKQHEVEVAKEDLEDKQSQSKPAGEIEQAQEKYDALVSNLKDLNPILFISKPEPPEADIDNTNRATAEKLLNSITDKYTFINIYDGNTYPDGVAGGTKSVEEIENILFSVSDTTGLQASRNVYYKNGTNAKVSNITYSDFNAALQVILFPQVDSAFELGGIDTDIEVEEEHAGGASSQTQSSSPLTISSQPYSKSKIEIVSTDLYNKNVNVLQSYLNVLNGYEVLSLMSESSDEYYYDINNSGIRVAFDCILYVFFDNLVKDFENESEKVSYELLPSFLFKNKKDLYVVFYDIIICVIGKKIKLNDIILQSLSSTDPKIIYTLQYFDTLLKRSINKRDEIEQIMYNFLMEKKYVEQYKCAVENNFTYYGFNEINNKFKNIISKNEELYKSINTSSPVVTPQSYSPSPSINGTMGGPSLNPENKMGSETFSSPAIPSFGGTNRNKYKKTKKQQKYKNKYSLYKRAKKHNKTKKLKKHNNKKTKKLK